MSAQSERHPDGLRVPPHSIEAEQAVLGGLLLQPATWWEVADVVRMSDFYTMPHRLIWQAMADLLDDDHPADVLTVGQRLRDTGAYRRGIDVAYLAELLESVPGVVNIRAYAEVVRRDAGRRSVITAANLIASQAFESDVGVAGAQAAIMALDSDRGQQGTTSAKEALGQFVRNLDRRQNGDLLGMSSGLPVLDRRWYGLNPGLIVIAGRPSMGKSALAMQMASMVADLPDRGAAQVLVASLEMPADQIMERDMARRAAVNLDALKRGQLSEDDWPRLTAAMATTRDLPIQFDDNGGLTIAAICARARRLSATQGMRMLVVDYLQLVSGGGGDNETERLGQISRALKLLSKELQIPVIAVSQLNRGLEQRSNRRPTMADIRGSGAIEQDADIILGIYRDEVYNEQSNETGVAELITLKNRDGEIGTDRVHARLRHMAFVPLTDNWSPPVAQAPEDRF